jgi:hypothetical protein
MEIIKKDNNQVSRRDISALHDYLRQNNSVSNEALRIFAELHSNSGLGREIAPVDTDNTLYYYGEHDIYYIFAIGGRIISMLAKPSLLMTTARRKLIKTRFLSLDTAADAHLIEHFHNLIDLSSSKCNTNSLILNIIGGQFTVHMKDLKTPYIEIGKVNNDILVIPMNFVIRAGQLALLPVNILHYAGQYIIVFANDDYTARLLYVGYILKDSLFTTVIK